MTEKRKPPAGHGWKPGQSGSEVQKLRGAEHDNSALKSLTGIAQWSSPHCGCDLSGKESAE